MRLLRRIHDLAQKSPHGQGTLGPFGGNAFRRVRSRGSSVHLIRERRAPASAESVKAVGKLARRMAKKNNRDLSLFLTTNGTLLDARIIRWLVADGWEVKVSLDGPRERYHDRFRTDGMGCGTYDRIERHVRTLSRKIPERFSTTSVLCKGSRPGANLPCNRRDRRPRHGETPRLQRSQAQPSFPVKPRSTAIAPSSWSTQRERRKARRCRSSPVSKHD